MPAAYVKQGGAQLLSCRQDSLHVEGLATMSVLLLQVVVDAIDPSMLVSQCASKTFDFGSVTEPELTSFAIPLQLQISTH